MATIDIAKAHTLSLDDAKKKAEELAKGMESKLGISWKWSGDTIAFAESALSIERLIGDFVHGSDLEEETKE